MATCPRCKGAGVRPGEPYSVPDYCPHCGGVGEICDGAEGCLGVVVYRCDAQGVLEVEADLCAEHLRELLA